MIRILLLVVGFGIVGDLRAEDVTAGQKKAQALAEKLYPQLTIAQSPLKRRVDEIYEWARKVKAPILTHKDGPLTVARLADTSLYFREQSKTVRLQPAALLVPKAYEADFQAEDGPKKTEKELRDEWKRTHTTQITLPVYFFPVGGLKVLDAPVSSNLPDVMVLVAMLNKVQTPEEIKMHLVPEMRDLLVSPAKPSKRDVQIDRLLMLVEIENTDVLIVTDTKQRVSGISVLKEGNTLYFAPPLMQTSAGKELYSDLLEFLKTEAPAKLKP